MKVAVKKQQSKVARLIARYNKEHCPDKDPVTASAVLKEAVGLGLAAMLSEGRGKRRKYITEIMLPGLD